MNKETKKLIINEHEAKAVKMIFQRIVEGHSYKEIIEELNVLGYRPKRGGYAEKQTQKVTEDSPTGLSSVENGNA